jgi:hypothetical protein
MRETWRWFGPPDPITLAEVRQTGAVGIVSALHHVPSGVAWTADEVAARKAEIEAAGLTWDVIESIPVSEAIKTRHGAVAGACGAWIDSLRAVVEAGGPRVICYNFMPVLDWTRTDLRHPVEGGGTAMRFDLTDFAAFDLHLLLRDGAEADYPDDLRRRPGARRRTRHRHVRGAGRQHHRRAAGVDGKLDAGRCARLPRRLRGMGPDDLRRNLITSSRRSCPSPRSLGLRLCCHPDDPPFPLLGPAAGDVDAGRLRDRAGGRAEPRERRDLLHRVAGRAGGFRSGGLRPAHRAAHPLRAPAQHDPRCGRGRPARQFRGKRASGGRHRTWWRRSVRCWRKRRRDGPPGASTPKSRCGRITAMTCWTT